MYFWDINSLLSPSNSRADEDEDQKDVVEVGKTAITTI